MQAIHSITTDAKLTSQTVISHIERGFAATLVHAYEIWYGTITTL